PQKLCTGRFQNSSRSNTCELRTTTTRTTITAHLSVRHLHWGDTLHTVGPGSDSATDAGCHEQTAAQQEQGECDRQERNSASTGVRECRHRLPLGMQRQGVNNSVDTEIPC